MAESKIYLTVDKNPKGKGLLAVMTLGHPQAGDKECVILTLEIVENMKAAMKWFKLMKVEQPWIARN